MTASGHKKGKWGDREEAILNASWALIARQGYEKTTMAEIAVAVGLSEGSLYNYVSNKRDLAIRVAERWFQQNASQIEASLATLSSTRDKLGYLVLQHLSTILEHRELYMMWIREVRATSAYSTSHSRDIFRDYTGLLRDVLADGMDNRELRDTLDGAEARDMILGGVEHVAWTQIIQNRDDLDVGDLARRLSDTYWHALSVPPSTASSTSTETAQLEEISQRLAAIEARLPPK
ncbi:MAG: TetR/AcrR family transcriptional regulator [Parvibaculaceae bacterium]|nr:TetR/AcrR family transcriptional regulator [Parvibaculaceae bacterium]